MNKTEIVIKGLEVAAKIVVLVTTGKEFADALKTSSAKSQTTNSELYAV